MTPQPLGRRIPYPLLCAALGLGLGWVPLLIHGPIPEKFNVLYIQGSVAVWAFYSARLLVGFTVGISVWPRQWFLRGPLCGFGRQRLILGFKPKFGEKTAFFLIRHEESR